MSDFILRLIEQGGYPGIFLLMALENIFPPIPSEVIMGLAGIEAGQGTMDLWGVIVAGTLGTTAGNYFWYWVGHRYGMGRLRLFVRRWGRYLTLNWHEVRRINRMFRRHGASIVFFFRFMPLFRTIVSLPAGLFRMNRWKFLVWTTAGAAIWNSLLAVAGHELGRRFDRIDEITGPLANVALLSLVAVYLWRLYVSRDRR